MPMQMWCHIAEAGQIYFIGLECRAKCVFDPKYRRHETCLLVMVKISHLLYMIIPDDPTKAAIVIPFSTGDADDPILGVAK